MCVQLVRITYMLLQMLFHFRTGKEIFSSNILCLFCNNFMRRERKNEHLFPQKPTKSLPFESRKSRVFLELYITDWQIIVVAM